jgi:hypothetical protein
VTPEAVREAAADLVWRTTVAQDLPQRVQDARTLDRVASLLRGGELRASTR